MELESNQTITVKRFRAGRADMLPEAVSADIEAICSINRQHALPLIDYSHLIIRTTHRAYLRNVHLRKETNLGMLPQHADGSACRLTAGSAATACNKLAGFLSILTPRR